MNQTKPALQTGTDRVLVIVPTYNESENLLPLVEAILDQKIPGLDLLVVDDNSPDGTGKLADGLAHKDKRVHVLHRTEKAGLGAAYAAAFAWALDPPAPTLRSGYNFVITMDADFSHNPAALPDLLAERHHADIVIGSRYIPGGSIVGWDARRYANSWGANIVVKLLLGIPARDATAGFKCYRRAFLESLTLDQLISSGYAFQVEMLYQAKERGFSMTEVPITFVDRRVGQSKISGELGRSASIVFRLASRRRGLRQFVKFGIVGAGNTVLDWLVFYLLLSTSFGTLGQLGKQLAKAGSFVVSASSSYLLNRTWTFRSAERNVAAQAAKFLLVASVGLALNNLVFYLVTAPNRLGWPDLAGLTLATASAIFWNFFANKFWTFREPSSRTDN